MATTTNTLPDRPARRRTPREWHALLHGAGLLAVVRGAVSTWRSAAEQPVEQGAEVRPGADRGLAGVSVGSRSPDRYQSSGAGAPADPHGPAQLAVLLDRTRRQTDRHHPEPDRHLPLTRHRCLHLPGRCAAAGEPPAREGCDRTHPTRVEGQVLPRSHEIRYRTGRTITSSFERLRIIWGPDTYVR